MSETKCSDVLMIAVDNLRQIVNDLESCYESIYGGGESEICDLAGTRIEEFGQKLKREIGFIEKLAEGAKILEEKV